MDGAANGKARRSPLQMKSVQTGIVAERVRESARVRERQLSSIVPTIVTFPLPDATANSKPERER